MGIAGIAVIPVLQRWLPKVPAVLVMVVLSIAATSVFSLAGVLPKGVPPLTIPDVRVADLAPLFAGALGIAVVSLADTISTASAFSLVFAELKDPARRKIERYGLTRTINPDHFFPTVESAVAAFRQETGAEWADASQGPDDLTERGQTAGDAALGPQQ